jgi:hypothetical protein
VGCLDSRKFDLISLGTILLKVNAAVAANRRSLKKHAFAGIPTNADNWDRLVTMKAGDERLWQCG